MTWVVGYNMPGYMPDSEPHEHEDYEEAKAQLIDELAFARDDAEEDTANDPAKKAECEDLTKAIGLLMAPNVKGEQGFTIGKWHYFLSEV
jgi:hypothetical protein